MRGKRIKTPRCPKAMKESFPKDAVSFGNDSFIALGHRGYFFVIPKVLASRKTMIRIPT